MTNERFLEKFIMWTMNYDHNWIEECFAGTNLVEHFSSRFDYYYDRYGSGEAAIIHMYATFDTNNRNLFHKYLDKMFNKDDR